MIDAVKISFQLVLQSIKKIENIFTKLFSHWPVVCRFEEKKWKEIDKNEIMMTMKRETIILYVHRIIYKVHFEINLKKKSMKKRKIKTFVLFEILCVYLKL